MTVEINLPELQRGDTVPYVVYWKSEGKPASMAGRRVILSLKLDPLMDDSLATLVKEIDPTAGDPETAHGLTSFMLEASETAALIPGQLYYLALRTIVPSTPEDLETTYFTGRLPVRDA
jgi:hypothetical protein